MEVQNNTSLDLNVFKQNSISNKDKKSSEDKEQSLEEIVNDSATKVTISMNAQYILFEMNALKINKANLLGQVDITKPMQEVLDFLAGGKLDDLSLEDLGYKGKPIMELSKEEAQELVSEEGFFGVNQTSQRVADFVFSFANYDLELLEKGKEGIIKGFEEAKRMFGGDLPEISYKTQERTLELIEDRINSIKGEYKEESTD